MWATYHISSQVKVELQVLSNPFIPLRTMMTIRVIILLAIAAFATVESQYGKTKMGTLCEKRFLEIRKEKHCIEACAALGYQYLGSWDGPGDFPRCTFTEGLNKVCHFNTNKNPDRTDVNPKYSAICHDCADQKSAAKCAAENVAGGKCDKNNWVRRKCIVTCGMCDPATLNNNNAVLFEKTTMGTLCNPVAQELATEAECITACGQLGFPYLGSWNGPGDFPKCVYTEGLNKVCHFNTSPSPGRVNVNSKYSAICTKV